MVTLVPLLLRASAVCGTATVGGVETDRNRSTDPSTASGLRDGLYAPPEKALRPAVVDAAIIRLDFELQVVTDAVRGGRPLHGQASDWGFYCAITGRR